MQRFLVVLTVVVFAASGCSDDTETPSGAAPSTTSTIQTATTTSADAAASTTLAPVSYPGGATYVAGRITGFVLSEGTVTSNENGTSQSSDGTINYTLISNDARVAGTVTGTWHSDR